MITLLNLVIGLSSFNKHWRNEREIFVKNSAADSFPNAENYTKRVVLVA